MIESKAERVCGVEIMGNEAIITILLMEDDKPLQYGYAPQYQRQY